MPDIYPNLPGVVVDLQERRIPQGNPATAGGMGQSLLILGTAVDGPVFTPVAPTTPDEAESIFGPAELDGPGKPNLSRCYYEAYLMGLRDIRLMRISGEYATASLPGAQRTETVLAEAREDIGSAPGNIQTVLNFTLSAESDKIKSVSVTADGLVLPESDYTVSKTGTAVAVTIKPEVTSSGVPVKVDYTYVKVTLTPVTDEQLNLVAGQTYPKQYFSQNKNWDPNTTVVIRKNGSIVEATAYTIDYDNGIVTFLDPNLESDVITASYSYFAEGSPLSGSVSAVTQGESKSFALSYAPQVDTFVLYTVNGPVASDGYILSAETKTVVLKPGYVKKGVIISASYKYEAVVMVGPKIDARSLGAGSLYNDVSLAVQEIYKADGSLDSKEVIIMKPARKKLLPSEPPLRYSSKDYPTFADLVAAVNNDRRNNVVRFSTSTPNELTINLSVTPGFIRLSGGDDGLNLTKEQFYQKLEGVRDASGNIVEHGAYTLLENYSVDHIALPGLYFDDELLGPPEMNFARQLAQFCAVSSMYQNDVFGYIGVKPIVEPTLAEIATRVEALAAKSHEFYMRNVKGELMKDAEGNNIDISKYVSIVAYPDIIINHPRLGTYVADPVVCYAALAAALPMDAGTTHEALPNVALRYELSNPLRDKLAGAQYVCFETSYAAGAPQAIVTVGVTAAKRNSDYDSLFNMKVAIAATKLIRAVTQPYIGKAYNLARRNAHSQDIANALGTLVQRGSLADFRFNLYTDPKTQTLRKAIVDLELITAPELRKLHLFVTLRPGA